MIKAEENECLTRVGPGTPAGEWLRRYWHPITISDRWDGMKTLWQCDEEFMFKGRLATSTEFGKQLGLFTGKPTPVRILGEDLVLFRDGNGHLGLLGLRCPHRAASLGYGRVREDGLECCYHGWKFDVEGKCLEQPAEPAESDFKGKVHHLAYPVREMGGWIWAYLGPGAPPILPKIDVFVQEDGVRVLENLGLYPCNYLQIIENSVDQTHTGVLHAGPGSNREDTWGREVPKAWWKEDEYGIISTQTRGDYTRVSHFVFPTINIIAHTWPGGKFRWPRLGAHWRTPVDDTHTLFFSVTFLPYLSGQAPKLPEGLTIHTADEVCIAMLQDYQVVVSQGEVADRTDERLGTSDGGILLLRKMIREAIEIVQKGGDPKGVWRNPQMENEVLELSKVVTDTLMM
jgi:5,5'-dehydrodivanillate O-demethylase